MEVIMLEAIEKMYAAGLPISTIADELGMQNKDVIAKVNFLVRQGRVKKRRRKTKISLEQEEKIIERYYEGERVQALASEFDLKINDVYNLLRRRELPARSNTKEYQEKRQNNLDKAVQMYKDGVKLKYIVIETDVSQPVLHAELARRDIPLRYVFD